MNRQDRRKYAKKINTPQKLEQFAKNFDYRIRKEYEQKYKEDLSNSIDIFILSIIYTLHFNEKTQFGNARIKDFMEDLMATIDNFNDGSYSPEEYKEILKNEGIEIVRKNGKEKE